MFMVLNPKKIWWQPALVFFSQATGAIVVPLLVALFVGRYLDNKYHTVPWIFLGLTVISFAVSCVALVILAQKSLKLMEKDTLKKDERTRNHPSKSRK